MQRAHIKGALVGVESVTPEGLKDVFKDFNLAGSDVVERLRTFRLHGTYMCSNLSYLGFPATGPKPSLRRPALRNRPKSQSPDCVTLTPFPGTVDFMRCEKRMEASPAEIAGIPITRRWLIPQALQPKGLLAASDRSAEEIRRNAIRLGAPSLISTSTDRNPSCGFR
jgi:hypothetical protein